MCKSFNKPTRCSLHTTLWVWMKTSEVTIQQIDLTFIFALALTIVHGMTSSTTHIVYVHMYALDALPFFVRAQPPLAYVRRITIAFNVNDNLTSYPLSP